MENGSMENARNGMELMLLILQVMETQEKIVDFSAKIIAPKEY